MFFRDCKALLGSRVWARLQGKGLLRSVGLGQRCCLGKGGQGAACRINGADQRPAGQIHAKAACALDLRNQIDIGKAW